MNIFLIEDEILALEELEHILIPYSEHHTISILLKVEKKPWCMHKKKCRILSYLIFECLG